MYSRHEYDDDPSIFMADDLYHNVMPRQSLLAERRRAVGVAVSPTASVWKFRTEPPEGFPPVLASVGERAGASASASASDR